ncbi:YecA family protein [Paenibacillus xylanexedens]|uniref:YecA family protein n=1 Tax=Paenibacillus xylanexedens TaxID=528191 RepID=UPI003D011951
MRRDIKVGRNDLCPCGSGKKHKNCCINTARRKFMSEFGLNAYTSHCITFYPNDLRKLEFDEKYHIYTINMIPKLTFIKSSLRIDKEKIYIEMSMKIKEEEKIRGFDFNFSGVSDHRNLHINFDNASKTIEITDNNGYGIAERALYFYLKRTTLELNSEILYIGRAFGTSGNRTAKDRLISHSTLQEIQSDFLFNEPSGEIVISLLEFTPQLITSFDGVSKDYEKSDEEDIAHMREVMGSNPLRLHSHMINVIEAAMINYFKPKYNKLLKNNFPNIENLGYSHYYDLDYNSIMVEIDIEALNSNVHTDNATYSLWEPITYPLHSEETRKSMFNIFD